ncbi:MAG: hypothetical protein AAGL96_13135 [Pseudomonadota bacterium]
MNYDLTFEIDPALHRRAVTTPIDGAPSPRRVMVQNLLAAVLFPLSIVAVNTAFFANDSLIAMCVAAALGAGLVLVVWWRQHRKLVAVHSQYNETGGAQSIQIGPDGIRAARPHIRSEIDWPFVRAIRQVDGAVLIELPTARLIVPDASLPDGATAQKFAADLDAWRTA